jgi:hypothetical protein
MKMRRKTTKPPAPDAVGRREFFMWAGKRGIGLSVAAVSLPSFLAACARDQEGAQTVATPPATPASDEPRAIVGDVIDFELTSDEWEGAFGFVTMRLHKGVVDGKDVFFIRTDASDEQYAKTEELVWVPKLAGLVTAKAVGDAYFVTGGTGDQATVLSSEPGRVDYTPAWRVHNVSWTASPRPLASVTDVKGAESAGDVTIDSTATVLNAALVKWSNGEMPADDERKVYLGPGQLLEAPDTDRMQVRFKLHECFPGVRYIVTDVSMKPMAEGMKVGHSPRLLDSSNAKATGRTNVFMNGVKGSGPMGFQPSVFDSQAGTSQWSPYWDHMTYAWKDEGAAKVLTTEKAVHAARDRGDLEEFPGTPDTKGETFVVNCPVPVLAPNTFKA